MVSTVRAVVCLSLWLSVCQVRGSHIPQEMNRTIQNLLQRYRISSSERYTGVPVFSREPLTAKTEAKRVFMAGVLEKYEELLGKMLEQLPTPSPQIARKNQLSASAVTPAAGTASNGEAAAGGDVRKDLSYILDKVKKLQEKRYHEQEKVLQGLKGLAGIKMSDRVVQSKALWELPWLYEEASSLSNIQRERRRRRRQTRRVKAHQRG